MTPGTIDAQGLAILAILSGRVDEGRPAIPVSQRERPTYPARTADPAELARLTAALGSALTRLDDTSCRLAFASSLKDDAHRVATNRDFLDRVRGWFAP